MLNLGAALYSRAARYVPRAGMVVRHSRCYSPHKAKVQHTLINRRVDLHDKFVACQMRVFDASGLSSPHRTRLAGAGTHNSRQPTKINSAALV